MRTKRPHPALPTLVLLAASGLLTAGGCASRPSAAQTGFLDDYSNLRPDGDARMVYASPRLATYDRFLVDPVEVRVPASKLSAEDLAEAARHLRASAERNLREQGLAVTDRPGVGVARIQMALTDVAKSTWWTKIHPVWRSLGAGTGGAAMEAQIIDSVTGEQLAAVIQSNAGNQFDFTAFSTLADVKSAIDKWAESGSRELSALRQRSGAGG